MKLAEHLFLIIPFHFIQHFVGYWMLLYYKTYYTYYIFICREEIIIAMYLFTLYLLENMQLYSKMYICIKCLHWYMEPTQMLCFEVLYKVMVEALQDLNHTVLWSGWNHKVIFKSQMLTTPIKIL